MIKKISIILVLISVLITYINVIVFAGGPETIGFNCWVKRNYEESKGYGGNDPCFCVANEKNYGCIDN